jgi:hypothetical protein
MPQDIVGRDAGPAPPLLVLVRSCTHPRQVRQQLAGFCRRDGDLSKSASPYDHQCHDNRRGPRGHRQRTSMLDSGLGPGHPSP